MTGRKAVQLAFGFLVSGFFIWLVLRAVPLAVLLDALKQADRFWVVAGLGFFLAGYCCRIRRWQQMLIPANPHLSWTRAAVPFMASIAANNVLPFRAGDALRAVAFSNWLGVRTASVLATLLAERLMDLLALLLALGLALLWLRAETQVLNSLIGTSGSFLVLLAIAISAVLLFPRLCERPMLWCLNLLGRRAPVLAEKVSTQVGHLFDTLTTLAQRPRMAMLMLWSILAWGFEACVFYSIARAIPDLASPVAAWLAMPVGTLSTLLPSTPGYIGTFHYFVMTATEMFGNSAVAAGAFAVLVHLALWVPATLWGGASFAYWMLARSAGSEPPNKAAFN